MRISDLSPIENSKLFSDMKLWSTFELKLEYELKSNHDHNNTGLIGRRMHLEMRREKNLNYSNVYLASIQQLRCRIGGDRFRSRIQVMSQTIIQYRETYRPLTMEKRRKFRGWTRCIILAGDNFSFQRTFTHIIHGIVQFPRMHCEAQHIQMHWIDLTRQIVRLFTTGMTYIYFYQ